MENYPIEKYRFIHTGDKTIAISTYAGRTVRGVAKRDPRDPADVTTGDKIAALRCALKIGRKRRARAEKKFDEAERMLEQAKKRYNDMLNYRADAEMALMDINYALDEALK